MAEIREVVIKIQGESSEKNRTPQDSNPNEKTQETDGLGKATSVILNQAFNQLKNEFISEVNYEINKHFNLTDDYIGQRNVNVAKNVISRVASIGTSIYAGAKLGLGGGPVGIAIGAVTALVISTAQLGVDIYQNYDQANINLRQQNAQLEFTRQRAGYSLTSGSIGDNK